MMSLNETTYYIVPIVNVDGFKYISDQYKTNGGQLLYIRKNRNDGRFSGYNACTSDDEGLGVDLNRNYDYRFAINDIGSSGNPCAEDYRGPHAFSEPETAAIRDFVDAKKGSMVMAFNFHAFGNLLIYPFNYDTSSANNDLWTKYPMQALLYEEIASETTLPEGNIRGNAMQAIQY